MPGTAPGRTSRSSSRDAVPSPKLTLRYEAITEYIQLPEITRQQVQHFFEHYKDLEPGKWVKMGGWYDAATARRKIVEAIERANSKLEA